MIYQPMPIGRVCRDCDEWRPRASLKKNKKQLYGVEKQCLGCSRKENKRWANDHPEQMCASRKKWRNANPQKQYEAQKRCRQAKPDLYRAIGNRWSKNHPDKARAKVQLRNARKRALLSTFAETDWMRALGWWYGICAYCGKPPSLFDKTQVLTQDHFIPVTAGGHYTPDNILPACKSCNSQKWNLDPTKWLIKRFGKRKARLILKRIRIYFDWVKSQSEHHPSYNETDASAQVPPETR